MLLGVEIRKLTLNDPRFPAVLREIPSPPEQIYVLGELEALLARPRLGVVGTRRPTDYGKQVTRLLVKDVVDHGIVTVSGLAFGIDALAHWTTLDNGGQTIAVMAGGLYNIVPASNKALAREILLQGGALISEYSPNTIARQYSYIARNRIIAGLSEAVFITEAGINSGSRHTAQFALDQNKTVMAVPGDIYRPESEGTNFLIKDYALPVTEVEDILLELHISPQKHVQTNLIGKTDDETVLLQALYTGTKSTDTLLETSKLDVASFNVALTGLELGDRIKYLGGSIWGLD